MNADYLKNLIPADPPITVLCPSGTSIKSTHTAEFNFKKFPPNQRVHVFPFLASGSLLSVGQLYDVGCYAVFHKHFVKIFYNNHLILSGSRTDKTNGLWSIAPTPSPRLSSELRNNISTNDIPYVCNVLTPHNNMTGKIKFLQASMGYLTKSTIFTAVKKSNLASYPSGINEKQINRHYTSIEPSVKGHLTQERQGVQSTTVHTLTTGTALSRTSASNDALPAQIPRKTDALFVNCI